MSTVPALLESYSIYVFLNLRGADPGFHWGIFVPTEKPLGEVWHAVNRTGSWSLETKSNCEIPNSFSLCLALKSEQSLAKTGRNLRLLSRMCLLVVKRRLTRGRHSRAGVGSRTLYSRFITLGSSSSTRPSSQSNKLQSLRRKTIEVLSNMALEVLWYGTRQVSRLHLKQHGLLN